jgi:hypothetical protein
MESSTMILLISTSLLYQFVSKYVCNLRFLYAIANTGPYGSTGVYWPGRPDHHSQFVCGPI